MAQGFPVWRRWVWRCLGLGCWALSGLAQAASLASAACDAPVAQQAAPGVWWLAGQAGDTEPGNQGRIANLLAVEVGARLWLVGAGATPVMGRGVACELRRVSGKRVTDLILPWPRAELTLGASAFAGARRWAHEDVARAMSTRCPRCVARMKERLGDAAGLLGSDPVRLPDHLVHGSQGRLGPFDWWRVRRSDDTAVLVLQVRGRPLWTAHGLLWGEGPPDLRDSSPPVVAASLAWLVHLGAADPAARWLPEQGPWLDLQGVTAQQHYLRGLREAVRRAQADGQLETEVATTWPGVEPALTRHVRHGLNWQRAWAAQEREASGPFAD